MVTGEWKIIISPIAEKCIVKIPNPYKRRILNAINILYSGLSGDIKPLKGQNENEWRLRVGSWRVLMDVDIAERLIIIKYIGPRGDVYKN
jgi:mRNA interferase RelE/StbE